MFFFFPFRQPRFVLSRLNNGSNRTFWREREREREKSTGPKQQKQQNNYNHQIHLYPR